MEGVESRPSISNEKDDCRVVCKDTRSLSNMLDITLGHITELAHLCNPSDRPEFISLFENTFKNILEENIVLSDGRPLELDKNSMLPLSIKVQEQTSDEALEQTSDEAMEQTSDEALCSELTKAVTDVARKRKFVPKQCSQIQEMKVKHDLQNLKRTKVISSSPSMVTPPLKDRSSDEEKFSEYCKYFKSIQETVQHKLLEKCELEKQLSLASDIKEEGRRSKSTLSDTIQHKLLEKKLSLASNTEEQVQSPCEVQSPVQTLSDAVQKKKT